MSKCICGHTTVAVIGEKDDRQVGRCSWCGLARTLNPPRDYIELYTAGDKYHIDRQGHTPYRERFEHDMGVAAERWVKLLGNYRLLDVGCANGGFVAYAVQLGADAEGVEINPHMAAWARERTGRPIYTSLDQARGPYDIVTLHDVIEHFEDPVGTCTQIGELVVIGGRMVVDTPDAEDPRFKELGMDWHHMKPREHLWFFDERTLRQVLGKSGFLVEAVDRPIQGKIVAYARRHRGEMPFGPELRLKDFKTAA